MLFYSLQKKWNVGCVVVEDVIDIIVEGYVFRFLFMYDKDFIRVMIFKDDEQLGIVFFVYDLLF